MADNRVIQGAGGVGQFISLAAMPAFEIRVISWHVNSRSSSWLPDSEAITHFHLSSLAAVCLYVHILVRCDGV